MTRFRRQVSALLVLLALVASACSSDPSEVVARGDPDAVTVVVDDIDSIKDHEATSSVNSTRSVAEDSPPREIFSAPIDEQTAAYFEDLDAARLKWEAAGVSDYDFSVVQTDSLSPIQAEVRHGRGTRTLGLDHEFIWFDMPLLFDGLRTRPFEIEAVSYHPELGYPVRMTITDGGVTSTAEIFRFRTPDVYPETCSVEEQEFTVESDNEIAQTHALLLDAAQTCDWLMLAHLADQGTEELTLSFGGGGVELLWEDEANGGDRMSTLAELLGQEPTFLDDGTAVWPAEYADPDSEYLGYRVGISEGGEWLFFVAGD